MDKNRYLKVFILIAAVAHLGAVIAGAFLRFIDGDEGGALVVTREVMNGRVPILDINAHNQPLLYYFYGLWMKAFGFSIVSGRMLSALAMFVAGLLIVWWVYRFTRNHLVTAIVYGVYITSLTFFKTNIPVKPFALSNLLTFASFAVLSGAYIKDREFTLPVLFFSGLLLGASMGVRLVFVLPFIFAFWLVFVMLRESSPVKDIVKNTALFTAGTTIPVIPAIWIFIKEPVRAYMIWVGAYAQIYLGRGDNPDFARDVQRLVKTDMMLHGLKEIIVTPDMTFLLVLFAVSAFILVFRRWRMLEAERRNVYIFIWLVFAGICYVYSNLFGGYLGYVNQVIIFMVVLLVPLCEELSERVGVKRLAIASALLCAVVTTALYYHFEKRLKTSIFYMFGSRDLIVTPAFVDRVVKDDIEKLTKAGDVVLDTWGVFVFASGRRPVKGFEYPTDNAFFWKLMPVKENARKYLYIPETELYRMIERKELPLLVLGDPKELSFLLSGAYRPDDQDELLRLAARHYVLYKKYFVKPTNAWLLLYVPVLPPDHRPSFSRLVPP